MKLSDFRQIIKNELQYGSKKVAYMCSVGGDIDGGMCFDENEALTKCKDILDKLIVKDDKYEFNIVIYNNDVKVLDTHDILNKIKLEL